MSSFLFDLTQILLIDLSLAGDNALVVGMAAAGLPPEQRRRAIVIGMAAATGLRILLAIFAVQLLHITGLLLAGGLLLAWVGWKMFRDLRKRTSLAETFHPDTTKRLSDPILRIVVADVSMSLDNVLGVAGVARDRLSVLIVGLALSVLATGAASSIIARITTRYPASGWLGLIAVLYAALRMIWDGARALGLTAFA